MKNAFLLIAIATICYSFQTGISVVKPKPRVRMAIHLRSNDTSEYFYNASGHILRIKNSKGNDVSYEYATGRILRRYKDAMRKLSFIDTMLLDKNGLVRKLTSDNPSIITQTHEFDKEKNLILNTYAHYNKDSTTYSHTTYEYQNGNEVSNILKDESGLTNWTSTSTYYTDKVNTIGNENLGSDFAGASSKNPVKTFDSRITGTPSQITNYNYHYDDKGRIIIKASYNAKSGKLQDSVAYSYY